MAGTWYQKKGNAEYERYIHSATWKEKAAERMDMDYHRCCVCGREATEVHHLTYDNFRNEHMEDLVSMCHKCHGKAEEFYDPAIYPWAMEDKVTGGYSFMAAVRVDAARMAPEVLKYIKEVRGISFDSMLELRQPTDAEHKRYWGTLRKAVIALCKKRYSMNCVEDRSDIMIDGITNHLAAVCLSQIEHDIRNLVQADLHETAEVEYLILEKWKDVAEYLGISNSTLRKLRKDDGSSFGPSLREIVMYYCSFDAAIGNRPPEGIECLTPEDYEHLNAQADYMLAVTRQEERHA